MADSILSPVVSKPTDRAWWKTATVYQIYPATFSDHASGGHGTLPGILSKVDYLKTFGVDILWLSPIYESPQADMGYDISNYQDIDRRYGTLEDLDNLKDALHQRGMKLVMDLVVNHSSDQHAWFKESRSSLDNPKRDWYIWRPAKIVNGERKPPNNWRSTFGTGSAWEWDPTTEQYYLHTFLKEQPDLNWENPEVRHAVYDMMHWWLKRGVDGFRMDVINFIAKAPGLPDAPVRLEGYEFQPFGNLSINRPEVHTYLKEMHDEVLQHYDCFCVGETPGDEAVVDFAGYSIPANKELQMIFHFHHQSFDRIGGGLHRVWNPEWKLTTAKQVFNTWQVEMHEHGGWNSNYVENHDQPRLISRMTSDHPSDRAKCGKLLSMFHCSLGGTIFVFQGEEMGMINVPREWGEEEYKDVETIQNLAGEREHRRKTTGVKDPDMSDMVKGIRQTARDNARTPMQWDDSPNAGFSNGTPWMRVHDDYKEWNIATQMKNPDSVWSFWKKMLEVRKKYDALIYGKFIPLDEQSEESWCWIREDPTVNQKLLVVLNLARGTDGRGKEITVNPGVDVSNAKLLISNGSEKEGSGIKGGITLGPWEGRIYLL